MAFDVVAAAQGLKALIDAGTDIDSVRIGPPRSLSAYTEAWIEGGDPDPEPDARTTGGVFQLTLNLIVKAGYVVDNADDDAELKALAFIGQLTDLLIRNRKAEVAGVSRYLNGAVQMMGLPHAASPGAGYYLYAGQEVRIIPLGVAVTLISTYGT